LAALQAPGLHPLNVYIASVSGVAGFTSGAIFADRLMQGIEKNGEYRQSGKRLLLVLGLAIVIWAVLIYVIISEAIPLSILVQFYSIYAALPALYFGGAITFRRWELKNGKEVHWEGVWTGTFYAIPVGLTWQQRYQYRYEQQARLRMRNSGEPYASDGPKTPSIACPRCGTMSVAMARYCVSCGAFLSSLQQPVQPTVPPGPQPPPYSYYTYPPGYEEFRRAGQVDNTKTGLLLLIIGEAVSWVPFVGSLGFLLALIGAVFVILGREAFGPAHDRNVILSIILFIVGIAATIVGVIFLIVGEITIQAGNPGGVVLPAALLSVVVIGGAITGFSEVLFTYALQKDNGRIFLWLGYAASIVIGIVNFFILPSSLASGGSFFFPGLFLLSTVLAAIPATLYATAFYLARDRIVRREIPFPTENRQPFGP